MEWLITRQKVQAFSALSGDNNALHHDATFAQHLGFEQPIAHGMLLMALAEGAWQQHYKVCPTTMRCQFVYPVPIPSVVTVRLTKKEIHAYNAGQLVLHVVFEEE